MKGQVPGYSPGYQPSARWRKQPLTDERCTHGHNPGTWPYVARCVMQAGHVIDEHRDRGDHTWRTGDPGSWIKDEKEEPI